MGAVDEVIARLNEVAGLTRISDDDSVQIRSDDAGIPEDYIHILRSCGFGDTGCIQLYSGPVSPRSIFGRSVPELDGVVLFGDDSQGRCFGFDTRRNYQVVEVDPRGTPSDRSEGDFASFLLAYLS